MGYSVKYGVKFSYVCMIINPSYNVYSLFVVWPYNPENFQVQNNIWKSALPCHLLTI